MLASSLILARKWLHEFRQLYTAPPQRSARVSRRDLAGRPCSSTSLTFLHATRSPAEFRELEPSQLSTRDCHDDPVIRYGRGAGSCLSFWVLPLVVPAVDSTGQQLVLPRDETGRGRTPRHERFNAEEKKRVTSIALRPTLTVFFWVEMNKRAMRLRSRRGPSTFASRRQTCLRALSRRVEPRARFAN